MCHFSIDELARSGLSLGSSILKDRRKIDKERGNCYQQASVPNEEKNSEDARRAKTKNNVEAEKDCMQRRKIEDKKRVAMSGEDGALGKKRQVQ